MCGKIFSLKLYYQIIKLLCYFEKNCLQFKDYSIICSSVLIKDKDLVQLLKKINERWKLWQRNECNIIIEKQNP